MLSEEKHMQVNGLVFKSARQKIRAKFPGRGEPGMPSIGTQEWLADEAIISLRAVQYLEKGEASLKTIKAVADVLNIKKWEELIVDYGMEYVNCYVRKVIDFRPEIYPPNHKEEFPKSTLLMSIDPLSLVIESGKFEEVVLEEVTATLTGLECDIDFTWLAEVSLTPAGNGWLGWIKETGEMYLSANDKMRDIPIMFRQLNSPQVSWESFIAMVEKCDNNQLHLTVSLVFKNFTKDIRVFLSVELLERLFNEGRAKYNMNFPYRVQVKAVT